MKRRRPLEDHARHPVRLAERDERSAETIRQPASSRRAVSRQDEVDVVNRPLEQEVANRAAHQPDGAADDLRDRREQRAQRLQRSERDRQSCHRSRIRRTRQCRAAPPPAPATASGYRAALNSFTSPASNSTSTLGPLDAVSSKLSFPARRFGSSAVALSAAGRCVPECWTFWSFSAIQ